MGGFTPHNLLLFNQLLAINGKSSSIPPFKRLNEEDLVLYLIK
jgi:hypothetical protein